MFRIKDEMSFSAGLWRRDEGDEMVRQDGRFIEFTQSSRIRCSYLGFTASIVSCSWLEDILYILPPLLTLII